MCGSPPFIGFNDEGKCQILLREGTFIPEAGGKKKSGTEAGGFIDGKMRELFSDAFCFLF